MKPDYAETGIPKSEYDMRRNSSNIVKPLLSETIEKMRTVCRVTLVLNIYNFNSLLVGKRSIRGRKEGCPYWSYN